MKPVRKRYACTVWDFVWEKWPSPDSIIMSGAAAEGISG